MSPKRQNNVFLVDYDLPKGKECTQKFYQDIKDITKGQLSSKSSKSVYITQDLAVANTIHDIANKCGISNIYKAKKIK